MRNLDLEKGGWVKYLVGIWADSFTSAVPPLGKESRHQLRPFPQYLEATINHIQEPMEL